MVTLAAGQLETSGSGSLRLLSLPSGYRPMVNLNDEWTNRGAERGYFDVYASGAVWVNRAIGSPKYSRVLSYPTNDSWPTALPGVEI